MRITCNKNPIFISIGLFENCKAGLNDFDRDDDKLDMDAFKNNALPPPFGDQVGSGARSAFAGLATLRITRSSPLLGSQDVARYGSQFEHLHPTEFDSENKSLTAIPQWLKSKEKLEIAANEFTNELPQLPRNVLPLLPPSLLLPPLPPLSMLPPLPSVMAELLTRSFLLDAELPQIARNDLPDLSELHSAQQARQSQRNSMLSDEEQECELPPLSSVAKTQERGNSEAELATWLGEYAQAQSLGSTGSTQATKNADRIPAEIVVERALNRIALLLCSYSVDDFANLLSGCKDVRARNMLGRLYSISQQVLLRQMRQTQVG